MNPPKSTNPLPYGIEELDPHIHRDSSTKQVRCFVRGCSQWLDPPQRGGKGGTLCPEHGIYCHSSGTYRYRDIGRNLIIDAPQFHQVILGNQAKYDTARFGQESSEDALSWNVFRSLRSAGLLGELASELIGESHEQQPNLWLWGLDADSAPGSFWNLLLWARAQFESRLPADRPPTEPDIALHLTGEYLILIEAKFTSENPVIDQANPSSKDRIGFDDFLKTYTARDLQYLDTKAARAAGSIPEQLWRNLVFVEAMARQDGPTTRGYVVNLVREVSNPSTVDQMARLIYPKFQPRLRRATWEQIYQMANRHRPVTERLCAYLANKTARLHAAFQITRP